MATRITDAVTSTSIVPVTFTTADAYAANKSVVLDIRGLKEKNVLIKNTGNTNALTWSILGSLDDGASFDIQVQADTSLAHSAQVLFSSSVYYTHYTIQVKSAGSSSPTTAVIKFAGIGI